MPKCNQTGVFLGKYSFSCTNQCPIALRAPASRLTLPLRGRAQRDKALVSANELSMFDELIKNYVYRTIFFMKYNTDMKYSYCINVKNERLSD